ncbi:MAG: universal stress protein [Thermoplasmatota archaeon]
MVASTSRRVLVPLDGSQETFTAMERGLGLLGNDVDVTLLVVQDTGFEDAPEDVTQLFDDDEDDEIFPTEDSARRLLEDAAARCKAAGIGHKPACKVARGRNVRKAILAEAEHHDVLLMHALGASGFKEKLRLSGTEHLARKATCHVLLVHHD